MSDDPLLLGLDIGTTGIKALLMDRDGDQRGRSSEATPFTRGPDGVDMSAAALKDAVEQVLTGLSQDRQRVAAVGVAGMAESGTALDDDGSPLGPIIAWHDPRGADTVARLQERFGDSLAARIGQRLRPVSSVAKLGWLREHGARRVRRWLGVPELCLFWLSGTPVTEYSLAARTGCFDVAQRRYIPEVARVLQVPLEVFPAVMAAGAVMGRVSASGATWSGLSEGIPVTLAGHDHLAGAEGVGAGEHDLVNSVGTAETVLRLHPEVPDIDKALALELAVTVHPGGRGWAVLSSAARAGFVLDAAAGALGRSPSALDDLADGADSVDASVLLASIDEGETPRVPEGAPGEVWNGLLEALAEQTVEAAHQLVELLGPARRLIVFGGGSRSRPWLRAKAQAADVPVYRSTATDAAARGAAVFAGVAARWWPEPQQAPAAPLEPVP